MAKRNLVGAVVTLGAARVRAASADAVCEALPWQTSGALTEVLQTLAGWVDGSAEDLPLPTRALLSVLGSEIRASAAAQRWTELLLHIAPPEMESHRLPGALQWQGRVQGLRWERVPTPAATDVWQAQLAPLDDGLIAWRERLRADEAAAQDGLVALRDWQRSLARLLLQALAATELDMAAQVELRQLLGASRLLGRALHKALGPVVPLSGARTEARAPLRTGALAGRRAEARFFPPAVRALRAPALPRVLAALGWLRAQMMHSAHSATLPGWIRHALRVQLARLPAVMKAAGPAPMTRRAPAVRAALSRFPMRLAGKLLPLAGPTQPGAARFSLMPAFAARLVAMRRVSGTTLQTRLGLTHRVMRFSVLRVVGPLALRTRARLGADVRVPGHPISGAGHFTHGAPTASLPARLRASHKVLAGRALALPQGEAARPGVSPVILPAPEGRGAMAAAQNPPQNSSQNPSQNPVQNMASYPARPLVQARELPAVRVPHAPSGRERLFEHTPQRTPERAPEILILPLPVFTRDAPPPGAALRVPATELFAPVKERRREEKAGHPSVSAFLMIRAEPQDFAPPVVSSTAAPMPLQFRESAVGSVAAGEASAAARKAGGAPVTHFVFAPIQGSARGENVAHAHFRVGTAAPERHTPPAPPASSVAVEDAGSAKGRPAAASSAREVVPPAEAGEPQLVRTRAGDIAQVQPAASDLLGGLRAKAAESLEAASKTKVELEKFCGPGGRAAGGLISGATKINLAQRAATPRA